MALQIDKTTKDGFSCPEAYVVIENVRYNKRHPERTKVIAQIYKDITSRDNGIQPFDGVTSTFTFSVTGMDNIIKQGYESLKLEDDMSGAIDV